MTGETDEREFQWEVEGYALELRDKLDSTAAEDDNDPDTIVGAVHEFLYQILEQLPRPKRDEVMKSLAVDFGDSVHSNFGR